MIIDRCLTFLPVSFNPVLLKDEAATQTENIQLREMLVTRLEFKQHVLPLNIQSSALITKVGLSFNMMRLISG